ncbi:MAG: hypothetical protein AAFQ82_18320, partial [Myxococcota bacterium]
MSSDEISDELLQAWMDGEAGVETARVEAYVERHPEAMARVEELQGSAMMLRDLIDDALGPVEPLAGMAAIRERIRERDESRWQNRFRAWWDDVWMFNRGAVVGVAFAAFAGVVAAPAVLWLMAEEQGVEYSPRRGEVAEVRNGDNLYAPAGISIESLEVGGNRSAINHRTAGAATTPA